MPKTTAAEVAEALTEERGLLVANLSKYMQEADTRNHVLFIKQHTDFQKLALAFDQVRQVMSRSSAILNLDSIDPLTITRAETTIYNEVAATNQDNSK